MDNVRKFIVGLLWKPRDKAAQLNTPGISKTNPSRKKLLWWFVVWLFVAVGTYKLVEYVRLELLIAPIQTMKTLMGVIVLFGVIVIIFIFKPSFFTTITTAVAVWFRRVFQKTWDASKNVKIVLGRWIYEFQIAKPTDRWKMVRVPAATVIIILCIILFGPLLLPPKISVSFPGSNSTDVPLDSRIEVIFDRSMIRASVDKAFTITPKIDGTVSWEGDQKFVFTPKTLLDRGKSYLLTFTGIPMSSFFSPFLGRHVIAFETIGNPKVILSSPDTEAQEDMSPVMVVFDRPMIPLTTAKNIALKEPAFTISPPVAGDGRWLGTTAYQFRPSERYKLATTYKVTVAAGIKSQDGGVLAQPYSWEFSSERPKVLAVSPEHFYSYASPVASVAATFSQPVDMRSAADKFVLQDSHNAFVPGRLQIVGNNQVGFYSAQPLHRGEKYQMTIKRGLQSAEGPNGLESDYTWSFTVGAAPAVVSTTPRSGDSNISEQNRVQVEFQTPMSEDSFTGNVNISPSPDSPPSLDFSDYNSSHTLYIGSYLSRSMHYTITIGTGVTDQYGAHLAKPYTFTFDTAPYKPAISIYPTDTYFAAFNADVIPRVVTQVVNANQVSYSLYRLKQADLMDLYKRRYEQACGGSNDCRNWQNYDPSKLEKVNTWTQNYQSDSNVPVQVITKVTTQQGEKLPPGFYFLNAQIPQGIHDNLVMIVTRSTLTVKKSDNQIFVWSVSQSTGNVVSGMTVQLMDSSGSVMAQGTTNADGVFMSSANLYNKSNIFIFGQKDDDVVVASDTWSSGINQYDFGLPSYYNSTQSTDYQTKQQYKLFLTQDRPIYRPGQKVYFMGVVRKDNDGAYANVTTDSTATVSITDARGRQVSTQVLPLTTSGSFSGGFVLSKDANVGSYTSTVTFQTTTYSQQFQVEEYKKPDLAMEVTPNKSAYVSGDTADVTLHASYYFGAPVADTPVTWSVNRHGYTFQWDKDWRYEFGDPDVNWSLPWWDNLGTQYFAGEQVTEGTGTTNGNGELVIHLPLNIASLTTSQMYVVEASVNDLSNQSVAASQQFTVHKASLYVGLHPVSYANQSGAQANVDIQTVDLNGHEVANTPVSVEFFKRTWETVREQNPDDGQFYYTSKPNDTSVGTTTVTTDALGHTVASFTPSEGGTYKVVARVQDGKGNTNIGGTFLWVSGPGFLAPQENNDRITLVTDKRDYTVGENMSLFVASPYASESAKTMLTLERGNVISYKIVDTSSTSNNFILPVDTKLTPNVFVGAVLVRPGSDVKKPAEFKMGYTEVKVTDKTQQIDVKISTDKPKYNPRDPMIATIQTKDLLGNPLPSTVAVGMVDKAVWDLAEVQLPDIYKTFYEPRSLGVATSQLLTISMDRINANTNLGSKGGSGGGCFSGDTPVLMDKGVYKDIKDIKVGDTVLTRQSETSPVLKKAKVTQIFHHVVNTYLIINGFLKVTSVHKLFVNGRWMTAAEIEVGDYLLNKSNQPVRVNSIERMYGTFDVYNLSVATYRTFIAGDIYVHNDKGGFDTSRTNFPDTAYWNPEIKTDQNGLARIKINLPDSLTTWRLAAIASSGTSAFGQNVSNIVVSRDTLIRPFLPRFLSYGDQAVLGGIIVNSSGSDENLTTTIAATGLSIIGNPSQTQLVPDGGQMKYLWKTTAGNGDSAKITLTVFGTDGQVRDKVETTIPVKTYSTPETVATSGTVNSVAQEKIALPNNVDPKLGQLNLSLSSSLGAGSFQAFNYLFTYPYDCTEQVTSKLLPAAYLYRILQEAKVDQLGSVKKDQLLTVINDAVQRLNNDQHSDGGWGWWTEFKTDPYISAYAYMGLIEAKKDNLTVADQTLSRAKDYLETYLEFGSSQHTLSLDTEAFILYALNGQSNILAPYASNLFERRFEMTLESRAYLAIVMASANGTSSRGGRITSELTNLAKKTATTTHWEEAKKTYQFMGSNTTTTAAVLEALITYNKSNPLIPEVIRYLMSIRQNGYWWNTRDTAGVMRAIAIQLLGQGDQKLDEHFTVDLNGTRVDAQAFTAKDLLTIKQYLFPVSKLNIGSTSSLEIAKSGSGNLYYNIDLTYYLPFSVVQPLEQGMTMVRELVDSNGKILPSDKMNQNTEAWERLTLVIPEDRHFVHVEDILPAGLESVNENLNNVAVLNKQAPKSVQKDAQNYYFDHKEYLDDRTSFFATYLPAGVYELTYRVRATTPGLYHRPPASAYQMYVPDVSGHSDGGWFTVTE